LDVSQIQSLGPKGQESLIQQMKDESPAPLTGTLNAWCTAGIIRGKFALINLVQTESIRGGGANSDALAP
jgi:hypothetical protein